MDQKISKGPAQLYVLSVKDIQRIKNCSYAVAFKELKSLNYFYINSKPYVLAREYFCSTYGLHEVIMYEPIAEGVETKLIKVLPLMLEAKDLQSIFNCGERQSYAIINNIPGMFKIGSKRYVRDKDFEAWLETLPNTTLKLV